jgi:hypothetical protein
MLWMIKMFLHISSPTINTTIRSSVLQIIHRNELVIFLLVNHREQTLFVLSSLNNHLEQNVVFFGIGENLIEGVHFLEMNV